MALKYKIEIEYETPDGNATDVKIRRAHTRRRAKEKFHNLINSAYGVGYGKPIIKARLFCVVTGSLIDKYP